MKKTLLIGTLLVGITGVAQNGRYSHLVNKPMSIKEALRPASENSGFISPYKRMPSQAPVSSVGCQTTRFTSAINVLTVGGGVSTFEQNCLSYNKDLNVVLWTSRISQDWTFSGKTSGSIQTTWYDIANNHWDSMIIYRDSSNTNAGRYPGGTIFNPAGNSSISGAWMVGSGPVTLGTGTGWTGEWVAARQPSGNYHSTNIPNDNMYFPTGSAPFGNVGNTATNNGFMNVDMQQVGQKVMVCAPMYDYSVTTECKGGVIGIGTYSVGSFVWSADSVIPGWLNTSQGLINDFQGPRMAFDPTGQIGYLVFVGRLANPANNSSDTTMMPVVYKSIDGGATWTFQNTISQYDWTNKHPEVLKNVGALLTTPARHVTPYFSHGIDMVVDAAGILHYITTLTMPYKDGIYPGGGLDSLQFTYTYKWDYINNHPIVWDLMTDGNDWCTLMIDSIQSSYVHSDRTQDTTADGSNWSYTNPPKFAYGAHLTASRSTDGTKIFIGWGDSDFGITQSHYNSQPDVWMKSIDLTTHKMSTLRNITNGVGTCYFSYLSDQSYFDAGQSKWVCPVVYTTGRVITNGVYDGTGAVDFFYTDCGAFGSLDYTIPFQPTGSIGGSLCPMVGIQGHNAFVASVGSYPNPTNGLTTITVNLEESKTVNLQVIDALGNTVYTKRVNGVAGENSISLDGSSLSAGVYYYTITAGYEKVTKKIVIQK
jgi:hypothetical protein